jgi:hypothetical protein
VRGGANAVERRSEGRREVEEGNELADSWVPRRLQLTELTGPSILTHSIPRTKQKLERLQPSN